MANPTSSFRSSARKSLLSEDLGREGFDGDTVLPGIRRQPRFSTGLFQESNAVPPMFDCDLRQKQPAADWCADEQPVAAEFDGLWFNGNGRRKNAEFDLQVLGFFQCDRTKAGVFKGGRACSFGDGPVHRIRGKDVADASTEIAMQIERCEDAARFGEVRGRWFQRYLAVFESREDRLVRNPQKNVSLFLRELTRRLDAFCFSRTRLRQRHRDRIAEVLPVFCGGSK